MKAVSFIALFIGVPACIFALVALPYLTIAACGIVVAAVWMFICFGIVYGLDAYKGKK